MRKDACRVLLLLLLSCATITRALGEAIDTLQLKAEWESSVRHAEDTLRAQAFADHLRAYLEQSSNWKVPLPRFDGVSDVEAKGGALRLITWAFPLASREWAHMGFLVRPRRGGGVLCVPLRDKKLLVGDGMIQVVDRGGRCEFVGWRGIFRCKGLSLRSRYGLPSYWSGGLQCICSKACYRDAPCDPGRGSAFWPSAAHAGATAFGAHYAFAWGAGRSRDKFCAG